MKNILTLTSAMLILVAMVMTSGCTFPKHGGGTELYPDEDYFLLVPAEKHEKRFPKGHVHKNKDPNRRCFGKPGSPNYFCQLFDEYDD